MTINGVLLDLDGTLLDSNDAHAQAWLEAMGEAGFHPTYEEVRRRIGMGGDFLIPEVLGVSADSETGKEISHRRGEIFSGKYLHQLHPFPGARPLVERLCRQGLRTLVASSSRREELQAMMALVGIDDLVEATSASDVENSKPAPDVVEAALTKLKLPAGEVVLLGDTPYDLESATRAGVAVIAVRSGGWQDAQLAGAIAIYDDVADLLRHYEISPLGHSVQ
jgi:HAD superfamily hydrolase (TIGR01509 family)